MIKAKIKDETRSKLHIKMDKDNLVTCPYNKFHQIRRCRIVYHLLKCEKNYPDINLIVCPYNATHRIREAEEKSHLVNCPDRRIVDVQRYDEPHRHGYLINPPFYGSSRIFERLPGNEQAGQVGQIGQVSQTGQVDQTRHLGQNEQNPQVFIQTSQRNKDLRDRVRSLSRESRNSSIGSQTRTSLGATSTASSAFTYRPLRRPIPQGGPPPMTRRPSPFRSNIPGRMRSTSSERRSLRSLSPASTIRSCSPSPVRQDREEGLPTGLNLEGGRLVPRMRTTSPRLDLSSSRSPSRH